MPYLVGTGHPALDVRDQEVSLQHAVRIRDITIGIRLVIVVGIAVQRQVVGEARTECQFQTRGALKDKTAELVVQHKGSKEIGCLRTWSEIIVTVRRILLERAEIRGQAIVVIVQQDAWHVGHIDGQAALLEQFDHLGHRLGLLTHLSASHG